MKSEVKENYFVTADIGACIDQLLADRRLLESDMNLFPNIIERRKALLEYLQKMQALLENWKIINDNFLNLKKLLENAEYAKELPIEVSKLRKVDMFYKSKVNLLSPSCVVQRLFEQNLFVDSINEFAVDITNIKKEVDVLISKKA